MFPWTRCALIGLAVLAAHAADGREACQERVLSLRFSPLAGRSNNWCWAASGQMIMELLAGESKQTCQCQQAEQVLGVSGCCVRPGSCLPADELPTRCDQPRWPAFVERPERYGFGYRTTCDTLERGLDDAACQARPLAWGPLTAELCAGRPVIATLHAAGSPTGHTVVVKGFSIRPRRRVLVVDPRKLCPLGRDCEGELDESFWISYEEYAAGWDGLVHWVDFYGVRVKEAGKAAAVSVQ